MALSGTVNAGSGTVTLQPDQAEAITVAGGAGPFILSTTDMAAVTAGTLQIDPTKTSTSMTVSGAANTSTYGFTTLSLQTGGNYTASGQRFIGAKNLTVNATGTVDTGTVSGGGAVSITSSASGTALTESGAITGASGAVTLQTVTNNGAIVLNGNVYGSGTTTVAANGSGTITQTAVE